MKILIIDRDKISAQMVASRLESEGHSVISEASKSEAAELVSNSEFDIVFLDPTPMRDARALTLNIKRNAVNTPYTVLMTNEPDVSFPEVMKMGCNDYLSKPVNAEDLEEKVHNAARLARVFDQLSDVTTDFPSAGGVISKSAFYQLCLMAMERGGRYNELAFILSISIENYDEIKNMDGAYNAEYSVSKMARHMVQLRRQSDIVGQTGVNEYSILLQRAHVNDEAVNAAKRFAANFEEIEDFIPKEGNPISVNLSLIHLPTGALPFNCVLSKK